MSGLADRILSIDEFFAWQREQDQLFELVEGRPQLYRGADMMAGDSSLHDRIITNIIIALGDQMGDGPCRPATADLALRTKIKSLRRADVLVTCDPPREDIFESLDPRMVIEVLSPSNTGVAWERKLAEYRRHPKLVYILLVDARLMDVSLYTRTETDWEDADFGKAADVVTLADLGCELWLQSIYRGTGL